MAQKKYDKLGEVVSRSLAASNTSQSALAKQTGYSADYISHVINGHKNPSSDWVDCVAGALKLDPAARNELHLEAARRMGYKIDLSLDLTKK